MVSAGRLRSSTDGEVVRDGSPIDLPPGSGSPQLIAAVSHAYENGAGAVRRLPDRFLATHPA